MTIHLLASSNAAYANRITAWLDAAETYAAPHLRPTLVCVGPGWEWVDGLLRDYRGVWFARLDRAQCATPVPLDHVQSGDFLHVLEAPDDDVVVFTDGDAYLQRPLTADEAGWLADWPAGTVGVSWNAGPGDTLASEAARLRPVGDAYLAAGFDLGLPVYNLGVMVARVADWRRWHAAYAALFPRVAPLFDHHARQQWGLCAAIPAAGLTPTVLPYTTHLHGHYPTPEGVGRERGRVTYQGQVVAFRHYL